MGLVLTSAPAVEPLALAFTKNAIRVDADLTADDALITQHIAAARQEAEEALAASLITQTWTATYEGFPWWREPLPLLRGPVASITSINYLDPSGAPITLSNTLYFLENLERSDNVRLVANQQWPSTARSANAVTVVYVTGYSADNSKVPSSILSAMLLRIGDLYRNREAQIIERATAVQNQAFADLLDRFQRTPRLG
jgi:uncharacterized phiE125 gp8 family phage protein